METGKRYNWPDIMKLLAIWMVFVLHSHLSGELAGFLRETSVAMFFFCSGFFAERKTELPFQEHARHYFMRLMVPYFFFAFVSMIPAFLEYPVFSFRNLVAGTFLGMRDHLLVSTLWFLPSLFCTAVLYRLVLRISRRFSAGKPFVTGAWVLLISVIFWCFSGTVQPLLHAVGLGSGTLGLPWSVEFSMQYLLFYALGAMFFPK